MEITTGFSPQSLTPDEVRAVLNRTIHDLSQDISWADVLTPQERSEAIHHFARMLSAVPEAGQLHEAV